MSLETLGNQINRRQLLAATIAATVAATSSASASAAQNANRVGFVDDNLDNFHSRTYLRILRSELKDRGFVIAGATALQAESSRRWADENKVPYFDSVKRLNEVVDYFAVLAPSNPQVHLDLCQKVLPLGKTTFVDKTFAPDATTAEKIFELADKHQVSMQTSSALRYTAVQEYVTKAGRETLRHMTSWGGGSNFDEYVIHPLELVVSCMGHEIESVMRRGGEPHSQLLLNFSGDRTAVINIYTKSRTPYAASVTTTKETRYIPVDTKRLFVDAAAGMLDFFAAKNPLIDRNETMAVMRIIDAARLPATKNGFVKV
jgi:predicted dehydrogenase